MTKGTTQQLTVNTAPQGADCVLTRQGARIAQVNPTPGTIEISKSRHDIHVRCERAGYPVAQGTLGSELEAMTFGNILIGGLVGVAVDVGTGAANKYEKSITIPLDPSAVPQQPLAKEPRQTVDPQKPAV